MNSQVSVLFVRGVSQRWLKVQDLRKPLSSPPRFIVRVMCSVLGLFVRQSEPQLRDVSVRVYIANHVTQFDHNVINLLTSCNTVSNLEPAPNVPASELVGSIS